MQNSHSLLRSSFLTRKSFLNPERWTKIESTHLCGGKDSGRRWRKRRIWRWYYNVKQCTIIAKTDQDWAPHLYKTHIRVEFTGSLGKVSFELPSPEVSCSTWWLCWPPKISGETCLLSKIYCSPTAGAWGPGWGAGGEEDESKRASQSFGIPTISHLTIHMLVTKLFLG